MKFLLINYKEKKNNGGYYILKCKFYTIECLQTFSFLNANDFLTH